MYLWNVTCRMPPPPEEYPVTFNYVNACGHFLTKTITTEKQFYAWRFLQWGLQAQGESLVTREPKRSGEDSGLARGQT